MTAAATALILAVPAASADGSSLRAGSGDMPGLGTRTVRIGAPARKPCVNRLRRRIVEKRATAWRHQDYLELRRDRTARRARTATNCEYLRWVARRWSLRARAYWKVVVYVRTPEGAIRFVFREYAREALAVARCESGASMTPRAHNGQYLGMFQMGSHERATYGHGPTPYEQARAARRYFDASGRDWSPWACQPDGSVQW